MLLSPLPPVPLLKEARRIEVQWQGGQDSPAAANSAGPAGQARASCSQAHTSIAGSLGTALSQRGLGSLDS